MIKGGKATAVTPDELLVTILYFDRTSIACIDTYTQYAKNTKVICQDKLISILKGIFNLKLP